METTVSKQIVLMVGFTASAHNNANQTTSDHDISNHQLQTLLQTMQLMLMSCYYCPMKYQHCRHTVSKLGLLLNHKQLSRLLSLPICNHPILQTFQLPTNSKTHHTPVLCGCCAFMTEIYDSHSWKYHSRANTHCYCICSDPVTKKKDSLTLILIFQITSTHLYDASTEIKNVKHDINTWKLWCNAVLSLICGVMWWGNIHNDHLNKIQSN